jgi:hypothetical protein
MFYSGGGFVIFFFFAFLSLVEKESIDLAPIIISQSIDILHVQSLRKKIFYFLHWKYTKLIDGLLGDLSFWCRFFFFVFFWNLPISPRSVSTRFFLLFCTSFKILK